MLSFSQSVASGPRLIGSVNISSPALHLEDWTSNVYTRTSPWPKVWSRNSHTDPDSDVGVTSDLSQGEEEKHQDPNQNCQRLLLFHTCFTSVSMAIFEVRLPHHADRPQSPLNYFWHRGVVRAVPDLLERPPCLRDCQGLSHEHKEANWAGREAP